MKIKFGCHSIIYFGTSAQNRGKLGRGPLKCKWVPKKKKLKSHNSNTWVPKMEISLYFIITHYKSARTQPTVSHKLMYDF